MRVKDLMTAEPISVTPDCELAEAAGIMLERHLSGLPVVNGGGQLVGVITEGDLLRRPELDTAGKPSSRFLDFLLPARLAKDYAHTHTRHVRQAMSCDVITIGPNLDLESAVLLMVRHHIKILPVLDEDRLVGVISRADLLRPLVRALREAPPTSPAARDPEAIRAEILAALAREKWAPKAGLIVEVNGDVVALEGCIFTEAEREALRVIVENTPGVKHFEDRLTYVDPGWGVSVPAG